MGLRVVILAAGKGKRMFSNLPKVMHKIGGVSMLERVVETAKSLDPESVHVVYGNSGPKLPEICPDLSVNWVFQKEQLGTGHAVLQALPACEDHDQVLVLYGDVPMITQETLDRLVKNTPRTDVGLLITRLDNPSGFGRIIRDDAGNIIAIVEEKDATDAEKKIREINTGILTAPAQFLKQGLPRLSNHNAQREYYLTDMVSVAVQTGRSVHGTLAVCSSEVRGVNDPWQLATQERFYQKEQARRLACTGVRIMDPMRIDIRGEVTIAPTTELDVNVILAGKVDIGAGCEIGPNVYIKDAVIGDNVKVLANSVIEGATIENAVSVGPFARIRPGTLLRTASKVGNFVEIKKTTLGKGAKASHLSYLGDAIIGDEANIGAGTITCNYDGVSKWSTHIGKQAFVGSNTSLVAPVQIGEGATIAAGSVVTKDAPAHQLTITRAKQQTVEGWKRPTAEKKNQTDKIS